MSALLPNADEHGNCPRFGRHPPLNERIFWSHFGCPSFMLSCSSDVVRWLRAVLIPLYMYKDKHPVNLMLLGGFVSISASFDSR